VDSNQQKGCEAINNINIIKIICGGTRYHYGSDNVISRKVAGSRSDEVI
jgi:hypothetical protein